MDTILRDTQHGIYIRPYAIEDTEALQAMYMASREHHAPFEPIRGDEFYTLESLRNRIRSRQQEAEQDQGYYFGVFEENTDKLIGQVSLTNIARGVAQYADLGYFTHIDYMGKGYMSAAVKLILLFAFRSLELHRIQASILLHNKASRRVLEKNGFIPEGIARGYLLIAGRWQDHQIYSLLNPNDRYD